MAVMNVGAKNKPRYRYDFRVDGVRYRGRLKKARTLDAAKTAEAQHLTLGIPKVIYAGAPVKGIVY